MRNFFVLAMTFLSLFSLGCEKGEPPPMAAVSTAPQDSLDAATASKTGVGYVVPLRIVDYTNNSVTDGLDTVLVYRDKFLVAGTESRPDNDGIIMASATQYPGDFNADGEVYFDDFFLFADQFEKKISDIGVADWPMDLDKNGSIGSDDFFIFADHFGLGLAAAKLSSPISDEILIRISRMSGPARVMAEQLLALCNGSSAASKPLAQIALRFVVSNRSAFAPVDTMITKDWARLFAAVRSSSLDEGNLINVRVKTVPKVKNSALKMIVAGAGSSSRFSFWDFFERDGRQFSFFAFPAIPGVSVQDSALVIGFKDSSSADYHITLRAVNKDGLSGEHSISIHRPSVATKSSLVFQDTVRVGDRLAPRVKRDVFWDGAYHSTEFTNQSVIAVVNYPDRLDKAGWVTVNVSSQGETFTQNALVRPRKEDDFLKITRLNGYPREGRISVRIASGVDTVFVSLSLNESAYPERRVAVRNDSANVDFNILFPEYSVVKIRINAADAFGNIDSSKTEIKTGDLTAPTLALSNKTKAGPIRAGINKFYYGVVVSDAGGFGSGRTHLTITFIDTVRKEQVFAYRTGLSARSDGLWESWGDPDMPVSAGRARPLFIVFTVEDDGGNTAKKDTVLVQPAYTASVEPLKPPVQTLAPEISVSPTSLNLTAQVGSSQTGQMVVSNIGTANLSVSNASASGAGLSVSPNTAIIAPQGQIVLTVTFAPTAAGTVNGNLVIVSNDADEAVVNIPIIATGVSAPVAQMNVSPTSIAFGDTIINRSKTRTFSVSNTGNALLTVSSIASTNSVFTASPANFTVAPGNAQTVTVTFTPTAAQNYSATLTITASNDGVAVVNMTGTGTTAPEPLTPKVPDIAVSMQSLNFGEAQVNASATLIFTVSNPSDTALVVYGISTSNSRFSTDSAAGFTLGAGQSRTVTAVFSPQAVGTATGQLIITSNDPDEGSIVMNLSGTGTPIPSPEINVSPTSLNLTAQVGSSQTGQMVVSNIGTANLSVSNASTTGAGLSVSPNTVIITPQGQIVLTITFAPTAAGVVNGNLVIVSNDADESVVTIPIIATGTEAPQVFLPDIAVSPGSLNFGSLDIGLSATQTIQVSNPIPNATANLENVSASVVSGTEFTLAGTPPATVLVGGSITVVVKYAPIVAGSASDTLRITSNDPDEPQVDIPLSGIGTTPAPAAEPNVSVNQTAFAFGNLPVGSTSVQSLVISNTGNAPASVAISPQTSDGFSISLSDASFTLAASSSRSVPITYAPSAPLTSSGSFTVASNDPDTPSITISCTGTGVAAVLNLLTDSINFGDIQQGQSNARWLKVRNDGNLMLTASFAASAPFSLGATSLTVTPGATDSVQAIFAPSAVQNYTGSVLVQSNGGSGSVTLSGTGTQAPEPNIQSVTLNGTSVAHRQLVYVSMGESVMVNAVVENQGTAPLYWSRIYIDASATEVIQNVSGSSATFADPFAGAFSDILLRFNIAGASPKYFDIRLARKGAAPKLAVPWENLGIDLFSNSNAE